MRIIAINDKVYRITEDEYNRLARAAEIYNLSMHTSKPNSAPYTNILESIAKNRKVLLTIDNQYLY